MTRRSPISARLKPPGRAWAMINAMSTRAIWPVGLKVLGWSGLLIGISIGGDLGLAAYLRTTTGADTPAAARADQDPRVGLTLDPELLVPDAAGIEGPEALRFNAAQPISTLPNPPMPGFIVPLNSPARAAAEDCLAAAIYYEAGFEGIDGQRAVAQVVLNRVRHPVYPKSVCGVVFQGYERKTGCQFSFSCDGAWARPADPVRYLAVRAIAQAALDGYVHRPTGSATHYHAAYVVPYWAASLVKSYVSGLHIFYRIPGYIGSVAAMRGQYSADEVLPAARAVLAFGSAVPVETLTAADEAALLEGDALTPELPTIVPLPSEAMPAEGSVGEVAAQRAEPKPAAERPPAEAPPPRRPPASFRDDRPILRPPAGLGPQNW